jgi:hypothetical protein
MAQYTRLNALGMSRGDVVAAASAEALTVAAPGLVAGALVGAGLLVIAAHDTPGRIVPIALSGILVTAFVVVLSTSLSLSLDESRLLRRMRVASETRTRVAGSIWAGSTGVLVVLAASSSGQDAQSSGLSALWLVCTLASVVTLPAAVTSSAP